MIQLPSVSVRGILERGFLVALLVVAYVEVIRPARSWMGPNVLAPVVQSVDTERSEAHRVQGAPMTVTVVGPDGSRSTMRSPGGILFLLPAVILIAAYPWRPYWLAVAAYVVSFDAVLLALLSAGVAWGDWAFALFAFLSGDVRMGTLLGFPLVVFWLRRRDESNEPQDRSPRSSSP
jgi:hypothetical protein